MSAENLARITLVCGGSGSGKSAWVKRQAKHSRRVLAWDPLREYGKAGFEQHFDLSALALKLDQRKTGRFAYVPEDLGDFAMFCRIAYAWGDCMVIAEELADVTSPGKAPKAWGKVLRQGRHRALDVYGITQRPAESDKTIIGNATLTHCCKLKRAEDRVYMAKQMDVPVEMLHALKPLEWVEATDTGQITRGKLHF